MNIKVKPQDAANILIGVFGSTSFYAEFDGEVFGLRGLDFNSFKNKKTRDGIYNLVKKIQSHWNEDNTECFEEIFKNNQNIFKNFFEAKKSFNENRKYQDVKEKVNNIVVAIDCEGLQNTKISKILHVLAPDLIPMIDKMQGEFILGDENYSAEERTDLLNVFSKFHQSFADRENRKKIQQIKKQLERYDVEEVTELRIYELLIWLQTQYEAKKIKMELIKR